MTKKIAVVFNPSKVDTQEIHAAVSQAARTLPETPEVVWFETSVEDEGQGVTQQALDAKADLVLAAGGDGTVRAVTEAMTHAVGDTTLGIIPLGTGNLLARNLGIPLNDISAAFLVATQGTPTAMDVGELTYRTPEGEKTSVFTVMCGFGLDAQIMDNVDEDAKEKVGWLAYLGAAKDALLGTDQANVKLSVDDGPDEATSGHTMLIGNCGQLQGGVAVLPDADPFDGKLDLLLISGGSVGAWADTAKTMLWDKGIKRVFTDDDGEIEDVEGNHTRVLQIDKVRVGFDSPQVIELDGDPLTDVSEFTASVIPGGVHVSK